MKTCVYCFEPIEGSRSKKYCSPKCGTRFRREKAYNETDKICKICGKVKDFPKHWHCCNECKAQKASKRNKEHAKSNFLTGDIRLPKSEFSMRDYRSKRAYYSGQIQSKGFKEVLRAEIENTQNLLNELEFSDNIGQQISVITNLITLQNNLKTISAKGENKC